LLVFGGAGNDTVTIGGSGANVVVGDNALATLAAGSIRSVTTTDPEIGGNDMVATGSGADILFGAGGNDVLSAGAGSNLLFGDNARLRFFPDGALGIELLSSETGGSDILCAGTGDNILFGQAGDDTYVFGAGAYGHDTIVEAGTCDPSGAPNDMHDTLDFSAFGASTCIDLGSTHTQVVSGSRCSTDPKLVVILSSSSGVEDVAGSASADTIIGNARCNTLDGRWGNDRIYGEEGNDLLAGGGGNDYLDGGSGVDLVYFPGAQTGVQVALANRGAGGSTDGLDGVDRLKDIQGAIGTEYADVLVGNNRANLLAGMGGEDTIDARGGNDLVIWSEGDGNDSIDLGPGNDTVVVNTGPGDDMISVAASGRHEMVISGGSGSAAVTPWALSVRDAGIVVINTEEPDAVVTTNGLCHGKDRRVIVNLGAESLTVFDFLSFDDTGGFPGRPTPFVCFETGRAKVAWGVTHRCVHSCKCPSGKNDHGRRNDSNDLTGREQTLIGFGTPNMRSQ